MTIENYMAGMQEMLTTTPVNRRFIAEQSFWLFALYYFLPYFSYKIAPFHYDLFQDCEDLVEGRIREAWWVAFREAGKTSIAKLFVIWQIACKKRKYINVDSFSTENAERILFDCAFEMSNNKRLIADFGILFSRKKGGIDDIKQNRINNFVTENGIRVEAHSTQESVRGRLHLNHRPDCLILDDIENNKTRDSEAFTKQVADHLSEAMAGMSTNGFMLYLGNYITEYGNIQHLFDRAKTDKGIRMRNIPILIDGKPAWEDKYALTDIEAKLTGKVSIEDKKRQLWSQVFSYEMMNQPIDDSIAEFKKEWIQRTTEQEIKHIRTNTFITIDSAVSEKEVWDNDYTAVTINRVSTENKWYIETYHRRMNSAELIEHMFYLYETYKPVAMGLEKTTFTVAIQPFLEEKMRDRDTFFTVVPLEHHWTKKETRIRGLIPRYESKSIFHISCKDLEEEMRVFPRWSHDDCLDSLAYQEQIAFKPLNVASWYTPVANIPQYRKDKISWKIIYS